VSSTAKRGGRSLGDIIAFLFKILAYFILGCIGFGLVVALFVFGVFSIGIFPMKDFLLTDGWQNLFAWGTLIFFIATPIIGILTWVIRRLAKIKTNRKMMRVSFLSLWLVGLFCFIALIVSVGRDFRHSNNVIEQEIALVNPSIAKLEVTSSSPNKKFYSNRFFRIEPFQGLDEDTVLVQNVSVHIVKSLNDSFKVTMMKLVQGRNKRSADTLAAMMNFNVTQMDSLLVLDRGILITRKDKFRNQRIVITVYVPVGKQIRVDRSVGWGNNVRFNGPWNDGDWDIDFEDTEEGWDQGVDYIMTATEGLVDQNGKPADEWKHPRAKKDKDNEDENGTMMNNEQDNYRYDKNTVPMKIDSLKLKMLQDQKRVKDSLQKAKDKIDKQLEKIEGGAGQPNAVVTYSVPAYNPMTILY
jgi:hypothetical protein